MTREESCSKIEEAIKAIDFKGECLKYERYGNGHINDTFLLLFQQEDQIQKYILQRMNHDIFKSPEQLMQNISGVTAFLREKIRKNNGDVNRETMNVIVTKTGDFYYKDSNGS
jgi:hypothetical protein